MPVKKNPSNAKKAKNVAGKRHAKLTVPKGEKVASMKGSDFSITKHIDKSSPILFLP
jgi:type VI protein secretion system component Hcp